MELSYDHKLCIIETLRSCGMSEREINDILLKAWTNEAGTLRSTPKILKIFKDNKRTRFAKCAGQGRPKSDQRNENVDTLRRKFPWSKENQ